MSLPFETTGWLFGRASVPPLSIWECKGNEIYRLNKKFFVVFLGSKCFDSFNLSGGAKVTTLFLFARIKECFVFLFSCCCSGRTEAGCKNTTTFSVIQTNQKFCFSMILLPSSVRFGSAKVGIEINLRNCIHTIRKWHMIHFLTRRWLYADDQATKQITYWGPN